MIQNKRKPYLHSWTSDIKSDTSYLPIILSCLLNFGNQNKITFNSNEEAIRGLVTLWRNNVQFE